MKRAVILLIVSLFLLGIFINGFVLAEDDSDDLSDIEDSNKKVKNEKENNGGKNNEIKEKENRIVIKERLKERIEDENERKEIIKNFGSRIKENGGEIRIDERRIIKVKGLDEEGKKKEISVGKIRIETDIDLTTEEDEQIKGERLRAVLSNGRFAEVKVMPDSASVVALKKMRAKCEENNCKVELKEVKEGDSVKLKYKIETNKGGKFLLLFRLKMRINGEVDAETGEIIVKKPWWAFLVNEDDVKEEEIEGEIEEEDSVDINVDGDVAPNVDLNAKISELVTLIEGEKEDIKLRLDIVKKNGETKLEVNKEGEIDDEQRKIWEEIQDLAKTLIENIEKDVKLRIVIRNNMEEKETGREKVVICHIPRDISRGAKTIRVGAPAVKAHLAHGDKLGECS